MTISHSGLLFGPPCTCSRFRSAEWRCLWAESDQATVNGEVLSCTIIQTSVRHDHQFERYLISDVKPVELHVWQLRS